LAVIDGAYAAQGTVIEVLDSSGARCGSFTLKEPGFYGYLSCNGDDPSTAQDEGASPGEYLLFVVDGAVINTTGMRWRSGAFSEVNLLIGPADAGLRLINQPARITADAGSSLWRMLISIPKCDNRLRPVFLWDRTYSGNFVFIKKFERLALNQRIIYNTRIIINNSSPTTLLLALKAQKINWFR
ncbi:MAG: hypothetical protein UR78_C0030G0015, partial [Candidatus Moranbacteria bacterium GW2011_GWF2_35_39]